MKAFDKRTVPGLEDCSSDSDCEYDTPNKKLRCDDEFEIEIEVKNNEFLKEEPVDKETDKNEANKRHNSVWGNVVQDEILDESMKSCGVNKLNVKRSIESYTIDKEKINHRKRPRNKNYQRTKNIENVQRKHIPVKERILSRTFDRNKSRNHIDIDPAKDSPREAAMKIARNLCEPKVELIEKCYNVLGFKRCLEFLYLTEDIESNGGLLIMNGSRRRSPGGVFLFLIKDSPDVSDEEKKCLFNVNEAKTNIPHNNHRHYPQNYPPNNNINCNLIKNNPNYNLSKHNINCNLITGNMFTEEKTQNLINIDLTQKSEAKEELDEELEDGEIP